MKTSTKAMCTGLGLSLIWFLYGGCGCDKEDKFKGSWVTCIDNKPTVVRYDGDDVTPAPPSNNFNPADYDCSHPESPKYKYLGAPVYPPFGPGGPISGAFKQRQADSPAAAFLPQQLLSLPFLPAPPVAATSACDSTYPDVIHVNHTHDVVTRLSTCPFQIKARIPVVSRPLEVQVTPDGLTALVTSFDSAVNFIDLTTNKVAFTLNTDATINPHGLAISPDGMRAYVSSFNPDNPVVLTIDMATRKVIATVRVGAYPQGLSLTPDGSQLWVTFPFGQTVYVLDTLTNSFVTSVPATASTDVVFNSTGTRAYISSSLGSPGTVKVVDTSTYQVIKSYNVGTGPGDMAMSYADEFVVVNNYEGNSISIISLTKDTVITKSRGNAPQGIAWVH